MKNTTNFADNDSINGNDDLELILSRSKKLRPQNIDEGRHILTIIATECEISPRENDIYWIYLEDEDGNKMWHQFVLHASGRRALGMFCAILGVQWGGDGVPDAWRLTGKAFCAEVRATTGGRMYLLNWRAYIPSHQRRNLENI